MGSQSNKNCCAVACLILGICQILGGVALFMVPESFTYRETWRGARKESSYTTGSLLIGMGICFVVAGSVLACQSPSDKDDHERRGHTVVLTRAQGPTVAYACAPTHGLIQHPVVVQPAPVVVLAVQQQAGFVQATSCAAPAV